jgi:hypothetical protein
MRHQSAKVQREPLKSLKKAVHECASEDLASIEEYNS